MLLADRDLWRDADAALPALGDADREAAEHALAIYDAAPLGCSPEKISALMGMAGIAFAAQRVSDKEASARLELYQHQLADIDSDVLSGAFQAALNASRFFPTIAEIREHASRLPAPPRVVNAWRLRQLLRADAPPVIENPVEPEEVTALLADLGDGEGMPYVPLREPSAYEPTLRDYLDLGLTEEDAQDALDQHAALLRRDRPLPRDRDDEDRVVQSKAA